MGSPCPKQTGANIIHPSQLLLTTIKWCFSLFRNWDMVPRFFSESPTHTHTDHHHLRYTEIYFQFNLRWAITWQIDKWQVAINLINSCQLPIFFGCNNIFPFVARLWHCHLLHVDEPAGTWWASMWRCTGRWSAMSTSHDQLLRSVSYDHHCPYHGNHNNNNHDQDGGLYTCTAVNRAGSASHSARLNVYGLIAITIIIMIIIRIAITITITIIITIITIIMITIVKLFFD